MKILIFGEEDIAGALGKSVGYSACRIRQFDMYTGNYDRALTLYSEFRPDVVIIDSRTGPGTGRRNAVGKLNGNLVSVRQPYNMVMIGISGYLHK